MVWEKIVLEIPQSDFKNAVDKAIAHQFVP